MKITLNSEKNIKTERILVSFLFQIRWNERKLISRYYLFQDNFRSVLRDFMYLYQIQKYQHISKIILTSNNPNFIHQRCNIQLSRSKYCHFVKIFQSFITTPTPSQQTVRDVSRDGVRALRGGYSMVLYKRETVFEEVNERTTRFFYVVRSNTPLPLPSTAWLSVACYLSCLSNSVLDLCRRWSLKYQPTGEEHPNKTTEKTMPHRKGIVSVSFKGTLE